MFDATPADGDTTSETDAASVTPLSARARAAGLREAARHYAEAMAGLHPAERLAWLRDELDEQALGPIVFTHGFGIEGQAIFHWIAAQNLAIDVVTLDTGRLFAETYDLWAETEARYGRRIRAIHPDHAELETMVARQGVNGFYDSREARETCCAVRKTRPLDRALDGAAVWITGARADQTAVRREAGLIAYEESRDILKFNPLFDWTRDDVMKVVAAENIPINALHAKGFASIGCAPCTRAIAPGEPERNGRWWWENDSSRECGLHLPRKACA